jgi:hypothetical protein
VTIEQQMMNLLELERDALGEIANIAMGRPVAGVDWSSHWFFSRRHDVDE